MKQRSFRKRLGMAFKLAALEILGARAAFTGAAINRLMMDWIARAVPADEEIRGDLRMLRARARELARNNAHMRRYFKLLKANVIGPTGMRLQAQIPLPGNPDELDENTNRIIETAWKQWSEGPVTLDGQLTLRQFEALLLKTMACDGEAFVRIWRGLEGAPFGILFQPIDADMIDETYNRRRIDSAIEPMNEIRMGVEIDEFGRRVGYWVFKESPYMTILTRERYFVPAGDMIHLYNSDRVNQTRGVTWIHAAMEPAHMLGGYEETEAVASRASAAKMGLFQRRADALGIDITKEETPATIEANPGTFQTVPDGYEMVPWDPEHPTSQFPSFVKTMIRKIASAVDVFYNVLGNDGEGVTYSTMRSFALIERDDWRTIQHDWISMWRVPAYTNWLRMALLAGKLNLPSRNPNLYLNVKHRPRGWAWIDPQKEAAGASAKIDKGMGSRTGMLAEEGLDVEEVFRELAREQTLADRYAIKIDGATPNAAPASEEDTSTPSDNGAENRQAETRVMERMTR